MKYLYRIAFFVVLTISLLSLSNCNVADQAKKNSTTDRDTLILLSVLSDTAQSSACNLEITGNWSDTSDGNAPYTTGNSSYTRLEYLGSSIPKSDYTMAIVSLEKKDGCNGILKLSGLQLDFSSWPVINTLSSTIYERIRFAGTDSGTFYYCIESYNKSSLSELDLDTTTYLFSGPDAATCGGFLWSRMVRR